MNVFLAALHKLAKIPRKLFHPITVGARAIILNEKRDSVLLVKLTYAEGWYLPGGKLKKRETITAGLKRELREEINFSAHDSSFELFGVYNNFFENKSDTIVVFICTGNIETSKKNSEIEDHAFFRFDALPESISPGTKRRIEEFLSGRKSIVGNW